MRSILFCCVFVFSNYSMSNSNQDLTPPQLIEFEISPKTVDVRSSSQQVTVLMRITDNDSGVRTPIVSAGSDINDASTGILNPVSLLSGDSLDGVWRATLTVPQATTSGAWSVSVFPLSDNAENSGGFGPGSQFDNSFTVISDSSDTSPPQLIEFEISPKTIDVSSSSQQVTVLMRITDNDSGVRTPIVSAGSDINDASTGILNPVSLLSGDSLDGVWRATLTVPQATTSGAWSVSVFPLTDKANNKSGFGPGDQFDDAFEVRFSETSNATYDKSLYVLPDINDDGVKEIGIFNIDVLASKVRLEILSGKGRATLDEIVWVDNFADNSMSLHLVPDMNDNGFDEVGLFGIQDIEGGEGKPQMFVRDLKTGNKVSVYNWVANWMEVSPLVLDDMNGDGMAEIAIQGRFLAGNRPQLIVKTGGTNTKLATYSYPNLFVSPEYYQHSDINGDGFAEIATFGRLIKNNKIQIKIASGIDAGTKSKAYSFPDKWDNVSWHRLDDSNGDEQDDWGLFGTLRADGRPQLVNKDGVSPVGALRIFAWPSEMQNAQFFRIPDMNNDDVDEVAAAGRRSTNGRYQFQVQDGTDRNVLLANHNLNLNLVSVTYHVLPDLSGDEKAEIGFMGINPEGEFELVIRHGDTANGEYVRQNLGSDWQNAPDIISLGDTDDDGTPNLLVYGQNAAAEKLIITAIANPYPKPNSAPEANAGADQKVLPGTKVFLTANGSSDADNNGLSYTWSFVSVPDGSLVSLENELAESPTFTPDLSGSYVANLIVNDGFVDSSPDMVTIEAFESSVKLFQESSVFFGGTFNEVAFPYSSSGTVSASVSGIPAPTTYSLSTFKLLAKGQNFTITNLLVTDSTSKVVPFFTVLSEEYDLVDGTEVEFELISPLTRGATAILNFSFEIKETGDTFSSSYTFMSN